MEEVSALSEIEVRILVALAQSPLTGYSIARQAEDDSGRDIKLSNGTLYPALRRLCGQGLVDDMGVDKMGANAGKRQWKISRKGRLALEWQLSVYRKLVRLGQERL